VVVAAVLAAAVVRVVLEQQQRNHLPQPHTLLQSEQVAQ
jgi:hypothetical protein